MSDEVVGPQNESLPSFKRPPVVEVVCGIQFPPIVGWLTSHYGLFWREVKEQYTTSEDQVPLAKLKLSDFDEAEELSVAILPPLRRVFLIDSSQSYLMQLQQNRFLHNWRRLNETDDYPRFEAAYGRFVEQWARFKAFLKSVDLSVSGIEAYELTYVNVITGTDLTFPADMWRFLSFYSQSPVTAAGSPPRAMNLQVSWPLEHEMGRLSLNVKHGKRTREASQEVLIAELTAKGPANRDGRDMESWFEVAHTAIVSTFAALTTREAHHLWERTT
jgi:uncharacterized protein (TIGR04255 family)